MSHEVTRETYVKADDQTRHALTFDMLDGLHKEMANCQHDCKGRIGKLENKDKRNKLILTGIVTALVALIEYGKRLVTSIK